MGLLESLQRLSTSIVGLRLQEKQLGVVGNSVYSLFRSGVAKRPADLATYLDYYENDSSVGTSIDALTNMTCGNGLYPKLDDEDAKYGDWSASDVLGEINDLNSRICLDELLPNINRCMRIYGYSPVERVTHPGLPGGIVSCTVYDSPSFEYKRNSKGMFEAFYQKVGLEKSILFKPNEIVWFVNKQVGNSKGCMYGRSDIKRVLKLLGIRDATIDNINGILKNQSRPPVIWKTRSQNDVSTLKVLLKEAKTADEDIVLFPKDSVEHDVVKIDTKIPYWEYVSYVDGLIFQGLHSPMLDYLRNSTEASSTSMLKVIELDVFGSQRYLKRMVEHQLWEWHLRHKKYTGPVPRLVFGVPKTGLEELDTASMITKGLDLGYLAPNQYFAILKQLGVSVPEPDLPQQQQPQQTQSPAPDVGFEPNVPTTGN